MASKIRRRTRSKRRGGSGGSRRGGRASAKRQATARRVANRRAGNRARDQQISDRNRDRARSGGNSGADVRSDGMTARDRGIMAASAGGRNSKINDLQQSVGSLDRRVEKALSEGNNALAKDLRSRQNRFVKELGYQRALNTGGGTVQGNVRTSDGKRPLTSKGFDVFQNTIDQDFKDPTRKLQNKFPDAFGEMYPITSVLNRGPLGIRAIQAALGKDKKQIPYNLEDMPGVRYPLDQQPFFGGRSRDPNFDDTRPFTGAPTEDVIMANIPGPEYDEDFRDSIKNEVLPKQFDVIDPSTRSEIVDETMGDIIDSGVQDFNKLDDEFQKESAEYKKTKAEEPTFTDKFPYQVAGPDAFPSLFNLFGQNDVEGTPTGGEQQLIDALAADGATNVQDELTSAALQAPGYNLNSGIIEQLFDQDFLTPGTNYFGSTDTGTPTTNPIVDAALASYYDSLN